MNRISPLAMKQVNQVINSLRSNVIHNYIAPGLDSYLLGVSGGKIRMFEMTREQEFFISPHNHRFDFACLVLQGMVRHYTYHPRFSDLDEDILGDENEEYQISTYYPPRNGKPFDVKIVDTGYFSRTTTTYVSGDWYHLFRDKYHSIEFSMGARVLFFEGADQAETSNFLEPIINGKVIPTFTLPDWMYNP